MTKKNKEKQLEARVAELERQLKDLQKQFLDHLTSHPWIWYTYPYTPQPTITPVPVPPYIVGDPIYVPPTTITWGTTTITATPNFEAGQNIGSASN